MESQPAMILYFSKELQWKTNKLSVRRERFRQLANSLTAEVPAIDNIIITYFTINLYSTIFQYIHLELYIFPFLRDLLDCYF
jgi:hypothetical protein